MTTRKLQRAPQTAAATVAVLCAMITFAQPAPRKRGASPAVEGPAKAVSTADGILIPAMREKKLVGLMAGVVCNGRTEVTKGYGVKSHQDKNPPDENTIFYIGSLSKGITAVGAMILLDEGKLKLDAPVTQYLKDVPKSWQSITIAQFMSHTSGIPELDKKLPTFEAMLRAAANEPLIFKPGSDEKYNNFNFAVMGKVIEAISGMSYVDFMKQRLFGPLQMNNSGADLHSGDEAVAYDAQGKAIEHHIKGGDYAIPSGHLQMTLSDLMKLHEALQSGSILKRAGLHALTTRVYSNFPGTAGWFEQDKGGLSVVTKNGATEGFHSIFSFVPGKGDAVIMLWTSSEPKGDSLTQETAQLLTDVCGVSAKNAVNATE